MTYIDGKLFRNPTGKRVGTTDSTAYRKVAIDKKRFLEHRLIWFYVNGKWPDNIIDHINGDPSDNRIENLRDVTPEINQRNRKLNKNSKTGHMGVFYLGPNNYRATIGVNKKLKHIGQYVTLDEAIAARQDAEDKLWK